MNSSVALHARNVITNGITASTQMHRPNINNQNNVLSFICLTVSKINNATAETPNIPKANLPDLSEFDKVVLDNIEFVPVESFKEVIVDATDDFIIPKKKYDSLLITKSDSKNSPNIRQ